MSKVKRKIIKSRVKTQTVEKRELTKEERIRAIRSRLNNSMNTGTPFMEFYRKSGRDKTVALISKSCRYGGSASDGFWEMGEVKGIDVKVHTKPMYSDNRGLIAEGFIPYSEVLDFLIEGSEEKKCVKPLKRKTIKPKQKKKLLRKKIVK